MSILSFSGELGQCVVVLVFDYNVGFSTALRTVHSGAFICATS